jgi:hypothetical protein
MRATLTEILLFTLRLSLGRSMFLGIRRTNMDEHPREKWCRTLYRARIHMWTQLDKRESWFVGCDHEGRCFE